MPLGCWQRLHSHNGTQARAYRLLSGILARMWVAKIGKHAISHKLGDKAFAFTNRCSYSVMVGAHCVAQVLGI